MIYIIGIKAHLHDAQVNTTQSDDHFIGKISGPIGSTIIVLRGANKETIISNSTSVL